ncbi:armadillo repeat-containing protein 1-like [Diabrotica virgifera virgifera]|uniref:Armadillo repeat-containing protein 1 n=1 Tax=Diabrotica virgifera virgifera TaxID=50390 RepID=A0ABM5KXP8_DIAVI|nr:armadillo repeat-containing protein 1-like [Diabrotica virgifera virgifera]
MTTIDILKSYKIQSENNNEQLDSKGKQDILHVATLLESENLKILSLCLDILENYAANKSTHSFLLTTLGIYEAIETLSIRVKDSNKKIYQKVLKITNKLRNAAHLANNNSNRCNKSRNKNKLYVLHFEVMDRDILICLEELLLKIKGVISFIVNIDMKRCTIRISAKVEIKDIVNTIHEKAGLMCLIVVKNTVTSSEEYMDIFKNKSESYYQYEEDEVLEEDWAITKNTKPPSEDGNSFLTKLIHYWNESLYW